jgi:hypothetical protein
MYQCKGLTANVSAGELEPVVRSQSVADADAAEVTQAQAFALSSRPGAAKTILLDFNGHTTTGTRWNTLVGRETIVSPAYDKVRATRCCLPAGAGWLPLSVCVAPDEGLLDARGL